MLIGQQAACGLANEAAPPAPARAECPRTSDIPPDPNPCLNWTAPLFCVRSGGTGCFPSIQSAIDAVPPGETILVHGDPGICEPPCVPQPWTYFESVVVNRRVCLKAVAGNFWTGSTASDMRYPVVIRSNSTSKSVVALTQGGSGSCIQGFKIDHRGDAGAAVQIGVSNSTQGAAGHADNVSIIGNLIDARSAAQPSLGVDIAGHDNRVHRNLVVGNGGATSGIRVSWEPNDLSLCTDWKDNSVNDNHVSNFQVGVLFQSSGPVPCGPGVTFGRIDRNDIRRCELGVQTGAGGGASPMRVHVMENNLYASRLFNDNACNHPAASIALHLNDLRDADVVGNRVTEFDIGIHLGYDACYTRVKGNRVHGGATAPFQRPVAAWVCPSHCNELIGNDLTTLGGQTGTGVAIDFTNRDVACRGFKAHGRHTLDGGNIHDVDCITEQSEIATLQFRALPGRTAFDNIECP